jgi:ribonuclease HIII
VNTYVTKLDSEAIRALETAVRAGAFELRNVDHAHFSARGEGVTCTVYTSGKCVVQGPGTPQFLEHRLGISDAEEKLEAAITPALTKQWSEFAERTVGSDETGKGDYFGPLVVAAVAFEPKDAAAFDELRLVDSKTLSAGVIARTAKVIRDTLPYAIVSVGPARYNELYATFGNLNTMLAWCHATAIEEVLTKADARVVIVDKFCDERVLRRQLKERALGKKLVVTPRAEAYPAVAAASILASDAFTRALVRLGQEFNLTLPKGAGSPVDLAAKRLVAVQGREVLRCVAKLHFKTTEKILGGR